jgi:hypothetical protein
MDDREKVADTYSKLLKSINITINKIIESERKLTKEDEAASPEVLSSLFPLFIVGRNHRTEYE